MAPNSTTQPLVFDLPSLPRVRDALFAPLGNDFEIFKKEQVHRKLVRYPEELAKQINTILRAPELRMQDPVSFAYAVRLAGLYRLSDCVPALVEVIDFDGPGMVDDWPSDDERKVFFDRVLPRESVVVYAQTQIGKPAVPAILALAADEATGGGKLQRAGHILRRIEGDLAPYVIEDFIRKSADPEHTRRMLEREPFVKAWSWHPGPPATQPAKGPATAPQIQSRPQQR